MKSKLEQFNLLDEVTADDAQVRDQGEYRCFVPSLSSHYSTKPADGLAEQPDTNDVPEYPGQDEEGDEKPTSEGLDQTTEQLTDDPGSGARTVGRFDEGESSDEAEPEQARPVVDEESNAGLLSSDEHIEQPVGVAENDPEQGTTVVTASDDGHPVSVEDLDAPAVHEHPAVRDTPPLGGNPTEYEDVVATNEDHEADYNENDQDSEPGETVTIEGDARDEDWETTASDIQQTQDDREQHEAGGDATGTEKREQALGLSIVDDLKPPSTDPDTIELTDSRPDEDPTAAQQGTRFLSTNAHATSNPKIDTDTDSIGRQTLDEFADARGESRDDHRPHEEGEDLNSNTGKCPSSTSSPLALTRSLDQSNELIPDLDQFGDDFNWDEGFDGDFDDGEFGEFEDQSNVEAKPVGSQEPISERSSKRGFDEIDSDTASEETTGDVSPSKSLSTPCMLSKTHVDSLQIQNGRRCCSLTLCWTDTVRAHAWPLHLFLPFSFSLIPSLNNRPKVKYLSVLAS